MLTVRQGRMLPRYGAFLAGAGVGAAVLVACLFLLDAYAIALGANAMFLTYLGLVAYEFRHMTADFLKARAEEADAPVPAIFALAVLIVGVAMGSLFATLNGEGPRDVLAVIASVASVVLGWFTVHTLVAFHYAYEYYDVPEAGGEKPARKGFVGGLAFPGPDAPDGSAFVYFSYVVGMTAQVSDVEVTSNRMRRLVAMHGVFSFFFNTVILAATVNVIVAVGGG